MLPVAFLSFFAKTERGAYDLYEPLLNGVYSTMMMMIIEELHGKTADFISDYIYLNGGWARMVQKKGRIFT